MADGTGEEAVAVDDRGNLVLGDTGQRLAAVHGFQLGEVVGLGFDGVGQLQQDGRALRGRGPRPGGEGPHGGLNGGVDLGGRGFGDLDQDIAGLRVEDLD